MNVSKIMKGGLIFLVFLMTIGINAGDNVMARLGVDANYLLMALIAIVATGFLMYRNLLLVSLILGLSVGANLPADMMLSYGVDRDFILGILITMVILPMVAKIID